MHLLDRLVARRSPLIPRLVAQLREHDGLVAQPIDAVAGPRACINGRWVLNFTATNYLGLSNHPAVAHSVARGVSAWGISLATPRLLAADAPTRQLETEIAALVGQERALVFASTTHAALDVLPLLAGPRGVLCVDEWAYPVSLEGASLAARHGARIRRFRHNDAQSLARVLRAHAGNPDCVVVCDGVYPATGEPAALREIAAVTRRFDAALYIDDAHGIGLLGAAPTRAMPYGHGGGGVLRYENVAAGAVVHVGSFSKAFGVPIAFVAGPARFIAYLGATAGSYTHSSPPALPIVAAARAVLRINRAIGDAQRRALAGRVRRFRTGLAHAGIAPTTRGLFPIQSIGYDDPRAARTASAALRRVGIWSVVQFAPPEHPYGAAIRFVLTAQHDDADIDQAVEAIARVCTTAIIQDGRPATTASSVARSHALSSGMSGGHGAK